jgi:ligand-binding sensor domain-containing protein
MIGMLASDRAGGLWVSRLNGGLLRLQDGRWEMQNAKYRMQPGVTPRALAEDAQGRIWTDAGQTIGVFENGAAPRLQAGRPGHWAHQRAAGPWR